MFAMAAKDYASDVGLYISCKGLLNMDVTSKSDPLVSVWLHDRRDVTRPWNEARICGRHIPNPGFMTICGAFV